MKKTFKLLPLILIVAVMLTMPVYAADLKEGVTKLTDFIRGIAGSLIEIGTIWACITLLAKQAKWAAVGTFIFGSIFAAAIAMPDIFKTLGAGVAGLF